MLHNSFFTRMLGRRARPGELLMAALAGRRQSRDGGARQPSSDGG